jgi:cellulose synthase/poly-beta-1,6-N-acetylglucosamine synthase-like glycosyltransferase
MNKNIVPKLRPIVIPPKERIEVTIPSRGRTINLVCLLQALRTQTFQNFDLTILDDNPDDALQGNFTVDAMLKLLESEGHRCRIIKGECNGLPRVHNALLHATKKRLVARIDDDTLPEAPDYLAMLVEIFYNDEGGMVAAAGGPIPHFQGGPRTRYICPEKSSLQTYAPFEMPEGRWLQPDSAVPKPVTTLYSTFLYKRDFFLTAGGYSLSYSTIAEKEETDILLRVAYLGGRLIFHPRAVLWHLRAPMGGIRHVTDDEKQEMFQADYRNFVDRVKAIKEGRFDWEAEEGLVVEEFKKYRLIKETDRGYIIP